MQTFSQRSFHIVSDLHLVGAEVGDPFACEQEFLGLLDAIAAGEETVLVLLGDIFDFWQMTGEPVAKLRRVRESHPLIFTKLQTLSHRHPVIYLPGNHDREASWDEEVVRELADVGIETCLDASVLLELPGRERSYRIVAEHGHASDPYNHYRHPPHPAEQPFGEHLMQLFINPVKRVKPQVGDQWLRDVDNVHPLAAIPWWVASKYFYREAGFWIKALAVPGALLFTFTKIGLLLLALQFFGVDIADWGLPLLPQPLVYTLLGFLGIDAFGLVLLFLAWLAKRDAMNTLRRWGIDDLDRILRAGELRLERRARQALRENRADLYVFGHTHEEFLRPLGEGRAWCNTGTWMKRLQRVRAWLRLPPVFVPVFRLTYIRVTDTDAAGVSVQLRARGRCHAPRLALLERLAILGRLPQPEAEEDVLLSSLAGVHRSKSG